MADGRLRRRAVALLAALGLVLSACGGSPTGQSQTPGDAPSATVEPEAGGEGLAALEAVYAEVDGLEGEERRARLTELAEAEDGSISLYTSTNLDESGPVAEAFEDATGVAVELYRASSEDVLQRLLQESDAGYRGADLVSSNGPEMSIADTEGLLLPLESPVTDDIVEAAVYPNWAGVYLNVFVSAWNTDALTPDEYPDSWEQVLTGYPGQLAMELGDFDWFATLVKQHFMETEGMTEEEAVELFREAARNASVIDGHTTMAELMSAGEYAITSSAYQHRIPRLEAEGAPVAWEPAVEPIVVRPNGIGIHRDVRAPASALLFIEYYLTEGQEQLAEFERTPANSAYGGVPEGYDVISVDIDALLDERDKWEGLYAEIVQLSGTDVISGD